MPTRERAPLLEYLHSLPNRAEPIRSDRELLSEFVTLGSESAFEQLVRTHGGAVWTVSRLSAPDEDTAQDIFQATFLVLARRASSLRWQNSIASWLYETARRIARDARKCFARRTRLLERSTPALASQRPEPERDEIIESMLLELDRLPDDLRAPVLACYLESKSREQVCSELGLPLGTLKHRLDKAKSLLRTRLARQGFAFTFAGLGSALATGASRASVANALAGPTTAAALRFAHSLPTTLSPELIALAEGVLMTMVRQSIVSSGVLVFGLLLVLGGGTLLLDRTKSEAVAKPLPKPREAQNEVTVKVVRGGAWHLPRGDARQTGVGATELPDKLVVKWKTGGFGEIVSGPIVADGKVFVATTDGDLLAFDAKTGKLIWRYRANSFEASPAFSNGRIYIGDMEGQFHCLDANAGKLYWRAKTGAEIKMAATFFGDNVLVGSFDGALYCLSEKGMLLWRLQTGEPLNGTPAVVGNHIFLAGCDSKLHRIEPKTGKDSAHANLGGQVGAGVALGKSAVFIGTMDNTFLSIDRKTGKTLWKFRAPRGASPFYSSAALTPSLVVVGSRDNKVWALDRKTGRPKWNFVTNGDVDASPVVVGKRIYVGSHDGHFYVLDTITGQSIQKLKLDGRITGSIAVGKGCLFVATSKGTVYCLGAK